MKTTLIKAAARLLAKVWVWTLILFIVMGIPAMILFLFVGLFRWAFL